MGLEMLSIPMRLSVVVATASLFVFAALILIRRRQNSRVPVSTDLVEKTDIPASLSETDSAPNSDESDFQPDEIKNQILVELDEITKLSASLTKISPAPEIRQCSREISGAAENARRLIQNENLLENPEHYAPNFKPLIVDFPTFVSTLAKKWAFILRSETLTFTSHLDEDIPTNLYIDPDIMTRILDSLLSNSQALTTTGRIHLHITGTKRAMFDWDIKIIVADTGSGIRRHFKQRIRNNDINSRPQNPQELNIIAVRDLTRQINGDLELNSVEGRGTEVTLNLKIRSAGQVRQKDVIRATGMLQDKRVLIIEDDVTSHEVLKTFLKPEGCKIDAILDGDIALETLEAKKYDLILMDVRMDGMDGIKTTAAIRNSGRPFSDIPIIAITADVNPDTNAKCMMAGANLFLNKPIGAKALFNGIQFVMDIGSADAQKTAAE